MCSSSIIVNYCFHCELFIFRYSEIFHHRIFGYYLNVILVNVAFSHLLIIRMLDKIQYPIKSVAFNFFKNIFESFSPWIRIIISLHVHLRVCFSVLIRFYHYLPCIWLINNLFKLFQMLQNGFIMKYIKIANIWNNTVIYFIPIFNQISIVSILVCLILTFYLVVIIVLNSHLWVWLQFF